jgi:hypothetical protein
MKKLIAKLVKKLRGSKASNVKGKHRSDSGYSADWNIRHGYDYTDNSDCGSSSSYDSSSSHDCGGGD